MTKLVNNEFETEVGRIELSIETNSIEKISQENSKIETSEFQIEIRKFKLQNSSLPQSSKIKDSCGWQLYLTKKNDEQVKIEVQCKLVNPNANLNSFADPGENLDAINIENNSHQLHIGTEDGEVMRERAKNSDWFPNRLKDYVSIEKPITEYLDFGFKTIIPQLKKDEQLYLHYLIASDYKSIEENVSTWYAVERSKSDLEKYGW